MGLTEFVVVGGSTFISF